MIPFKSYRYIYPPRPSIAIPMEVLVDYDNDEYIAQPKLNGDCMEIYTNGIDLEIRDRHNSEFKKNIPNPERFLSLHRGDKGTWMCLVGEHMIKSKKDAAGELFNDKFVIFDIIVYNSMQLIGSTFKDRVDLLDQLYDTDDKELLESGVRRHTFLYVTDTPTVYRVKSFYNCFTVIWQDLVEIDMMEGLVLKKADAKLENGRTELNNVNSMFKARKPTKNYLY